MNRGPMSRSTAVAIVLIAFLIGIAVAKSGFRFDQTTILTAAFLCVIFRKTKIVLLIAVVWLSFGLGSIRGHVFSSQLTDYQQLFGQKVSVQGRVIDDPRYDDRGQTEFQVSDISIEGQELPGKARIRSFNAIGLQRGDTVVATAKLYKGYGSRQASLSFAELEIISRSNNPIERIRRQYFAGVYSSIPEPQASLGLGFLVGLRALLPDELLDQLQATGLTHIVAVSGYNVTVLIRITRRWFSRFSRFTSLAASFTLIGLFLLVTGGAASITRAAVVAVVALLAWYFGRKISPLALLLIGAAVTAGINPLFLWFDLGWWLSFLAFFGVLILAPAFEARFLKRKLNLIGRTLLETSSAQIAVLPLILTIFGQTSIIALIANMIILPLIPIAMLLSFVAGTAGSLIPALAGWFAWPATQLLTAMTTVIRILAGVPGALVEVDMSTQQMIVLYGILVLFVLVISRRQSLRSFFDD